MSKKGYTEEADEVVKTKTGVGSKLKSFGKPIIKKAAKR